jgi:hypothetical protein
VNIQAAKYSYLDTNSLMLAVETEFRKLSKILRGMLSTYSISKTAEICELTSNGVNVFSVVLMTVNMACATENACAQL